MEPGRKRIKYWQWLPILVFWLLVWQLAYILIDSDLLLASPLQVGVRLIVLVGESHFWLTAGLSILRITAGFLLGVVIGVVLAVLTVRIRLMWLLLRPVIVAIRATPIASFIILALVWMTKARVVIFIVLLMVVPIVWANVVEGIRKTDPQLLEMAQIFGLTSSQVLRLIYLPSVSPFFLAAVTTALGLGWKAGIAAEVLSTPQPSLGSELYNAKIYLETPNLLAYTLVIIVLSLILEKLLLWVLNRAESYFKTHGRLGDAA
jgi:NitT/TauT family transport system permease protein